MTSYSGLMDVTELLRKPPSMPSGYDDYLFALAFLAPLAVQFLNATANWRDDFQHLYRWALVDQDLRGATIHGLIRPRSEVLAKYRTRRDPPERDQLHFTEHIVLDQHS